MLRSIDGDEYEFKMGQGDIICGNAEVREEKEEEGRERELLARYGGTDERPLHVSTCTRMRMRYIQVIPEVVEVIKAADHKMWRKVRLFWFSLHAAGTLYYIQ